MDHVAPSSPHRLPGTAERRAERGRRCTGEGVQQRQLEALREAGGEALHVHLRAVPPLGLQEYLRPAPARPPLQGATSPPQLHHVALPTITSTHVAQDSQSGVQHHSFDCA